MTPPLVSVVIPTWNGRAELERCLRSLREHTQSAQLELIVVDNNSSDGTPEVVERDFPDVRVIRNEANEGFARACNQGMAAATGQLLLLLNSDTYVEDDVIGRAGARLLERPDVGMLGCALSLPEGRRQHTANRRLGIRRSLVERLWLYKLLPRKRRAEYLLGGYWEERREVEADWLAGAFLLLRRELFERSGGLDPRLFAYDGEDCEWCMRLRRMGYRILYSPQVGTVYHVGAVSSERLGWDERDRVERGHRGGILAYGLVYGDARAALFRLAELIGTTVRWVVYTMVARVRGDAYAKAQAQHYGWLAMFYLRARDTLPRARLRHGALRAAGP